jgi:hypothetical protein
MTEHDLTPEQLVQRAYDRGEVIRAEAPDGTERAMVHTGIDLPNPWAVRAQTEAQASLWTRSRVKRIVEQSEPSVYTVPYEKSRWGDERD